MKIIVSKKSVYGKDLIYPICDKAKLFALISDKVTLSPKVINLIKKLGYQIKDPAEGPKVKSVK